MEGFQAHFPALSLERIEHLLEECIMVAVRSREKFNMQQPAKRIQIAVSLGPYGAVLADGSEYTGSYKDTMLVVCLTQM